MNRRQKAKSSVFHGRMGRLAVSTLLSLFIGSMSSGADSQKGAPQIAKTVPENGAKDVDPELNEVRVTFDRDMEEGMSWTGGPPEFPTTDKKRAAKWIDKRTCVLPVILEAGKSYRIGINSKSFQNFSSVDGVPAKPSAITFTTKGGSDDSATGIPTIVKMEPENNATDVDPATKELKVTFNMEMAGSFSWTGGGPDFPTIPDGKKPKWSTDGKTCTLPVILEPEHDYEIGINSPSFKNFKSKAGQPVNPVVFKFRTGRAKQ